MGLRFGSAGAHTYRKSEQDATLPPRIKEGISLRKFAAVLSGRLPESYDNFLTYLNTRDAEDLDWKSILKGLLIKEYMNCKEKNEKQKSDDAVFTRKGQSVQVEVEPVAAILEIRVTINHRHTIEVTKNN